MADYETDDQHDKRKEEYQTLKQQKANLETQIANWMDKAASLHADSIGQDYKDRVIEQRDSFVLAARTSLGV